MFQYQAFSDDLNSAVRVPDVTLWDTLTADFGTGNFMTMLLAQLEETGNENTKKNLFELLLELKFCKVCHRGHVNHSTVIHMLFYFVALPGCRHVTSKFEHNFKNPKSKYSLPVSM